MANGDDWRYGSDYHQELYRGGQRMPFNICKTHVGGDWMYELWSTSGKVPIAYYRNPGPLKRHEALTAVTK